jgi:hypothetical protein
VGRKNLNVVLKLEQPPDTVILLDGPVHSAEVRPSHVAHGQTVPGKHHGRFGAPRRVDHQQRQRLGAVPRRMHHPENDLADVKCVTVAHRVEGKESIGLFVEIQLRTRRRGQAPVPRDVVGIQMRIVISTML